MDQYDKDRIYNPIVQLASGDDDSLRLSQRLFAQLIAYPNQEDAIQHAIEVFLGLNPPQRIQLLRGVQVHLDQNRYPCLAFENNGNFFDHLMQRLNDEMARTEEVSDETMWSWFRRIRSDIRRQLVHGTPEHVQRITELTTQIRTAATQVSVEGGKLKISPAFDAFLGTLTDHQLGNIILFIGDIRNIKACRDRFREVVDEHYIAQKLGNTPSDGEQIASAFGMSTYIHGLTKDFHAYLRPEPEIVREITEMDFVELTLLMDHVSDCRSRKFRQGESLFRVKS